jgi:phosphate-selective porin OprO/OprP
MTKTIIKHPAKFSATSRRVSQGILGILALSSLQTGALYGQDDLASLRAQLKALEAKVAALETGQKASTNDDALKEKLEKLPVVTLDSKGLNFSSPGIRTTRTEVGPDGIPVETTTVTDEGAFKFKIGGLIQPQLRTFINTPDATSTFLIRRARLNLEGTVFKNFDWKLQTDFQANGVDNTTSTTVQDAYVGAKGYDWLQLRVGKMKSPIGIERWQSAHARWFTDLITTTYIVPNRVVSSDN